jgi:hypothetical protein
MTSITTLRTNSVVDLRAAVEREISAGRPILLLFEVLPEEVPDHLVGSDLHSRFLREYLRERESQAYDFLVTIRGEQADDKDHLFQELRYAVPLADYMGSNYDAISDVLRNEALSKDPGRRTLWVWRHCHVLFKGDLQSFVAAFHTIAFCAREVSVGFSTKTGKTIPPWPNWSSQPVGVILTGLWGVMGDEVSRSDSPLYRFPEWATPLLSEPSTRLAVFRITSP